MHAVGTKTRTIMISAGMLIQAMITDLSHTPQLEYLLVKCWLEGALAARTLAFGKQFS